MFNKSFSVKLLFTFTLALTMVTFFTSNGLAVDWKWLSSKGAANKKAEDIYRQATSAYGSADYSKVIDLTGKALKEDDKFAKAYALRGKAKKDMGDIDAAFKDLDQAIKIDPKLGEAYYIRGQANEIMGEMKKAEADYHKGCKAGFKLACD